MIQRSYDNIENLAPKMLFITEDLIQASTNREFILQTFSRKDKRREILLACIEGKQEGKIL
jgi:hypothetical protein